LDGEPFRYISGSIHYFRVHPSDWKDRLYRIRALGFNAIQYYIPWNFHEIFEGEYDFSGWRNFSEFSYIAHDLGLYTLLRIGPYSCGEWENGGFPWWLLNKENCQTRTSQKGFLDAVEKWFTVLLEVIRPLMRQNGGPVLMLQIENEYGSSAFCDRVYTYWLRDFVRSRLGNDTVIYTTDGGSAEYLKCGFVPGTFPTVDFGHGPLVNSEFYPGWFVLWGEKSARIPSTDSIMKSAKYMYSLGASFNFYMIHGGTNFAFWNGAATAAPVITSYDYFAPISEAGDVTDKKTAYGNVTMVLINGFGDQATDMCEDSEDPMSFEKLEQPFGFVIYIKVLNFYSLKLETCGKTLDIKQLKDFGYVILNGNHTGTFMNSYYGKAKRSVDLERCNPGDMLSILVENTARLTSGIENDRKGILSEVRLDNQVLKGWTQCKMLFPNEDISKKNWSEEQQPLGKLGLYIGYFYVKEATDTFLNTTGWGKGIAILNGNNLGRYWPTEGPQHTLYVPAAYVRRGSNVLIMLELEGTSTCQQTSCSVSFVDQPIFVWKKITTVGDFFSGGRGRRRSKNRRRN
ncbi:glycosyl hydrolase family 35, partial [Ancylostoma caninum]